MLRAYFTQSYYLFNFIEFINFNVILRFTYKPFFYIIFFFKLIIFVIYIYIILNFILILTINKYFNYLMK